MADFDAYTNVRVRGSTIPQYPEPPLGWFVIAVVRRWRGRRVWVALLADGDGIEASRMCCWFGIPGEHASCFDAECALAELRATWH